MRDISDEGPVSPTSAVGTTIGTSTALLLVDTILSLESSGFSKYFSAPW